MAQEIKLHRDLHHAHIVKFVSSFESMFRNVNYCITINYNI